MKIEEETGIRSAVETYREPWETCSVGEEIGMAVSYLAERLCYRVSFLLVGICKRCLLAAGDYWRAKGEGMGHVRRGLREEEPGVYCLPGKKPIVVADTGRERFLDSLHAFCASGAAQRPLTHRMLRFYAYGHQPLCWIDRQREFRRTGTRIAALCDVYTDFPLLFESPNPTHYANSQKRPQTKRSFNETRSAR